MTIIKILSFIKSLDIVKSYVYSDNGLVVEASGLEREKAEELAAWVPALARQAEGKLGLRNPLVMIFKDPGEEMLVYQDGDEAIIIEPEDKASPPLLESVSGQGPHCEVCGGDLSLTIIVCPKCGSRVPFTARVCPRCGYRIDLRKCPYCDAVITSSGARAGLPRLFKKVAESTLISNELRSK